MKKYGITCLLLLVFSTSQLFAQSKKTEYKSVDEFVITLGALNTLNVARIADTLTRKLADKELKARAIFYWIANNISLDLKAIKSNDEKRSLPEDVVKYRKATSLGFAKLFQEMSSLANIRCLVVDGYVKNNIDELNQPEDDINHSWNVLQLGQSPELWFYVDAAKASGTADKKMTTFTKNFTSEYFFADRILFNLDHYPKNDAWQLGPGPKSLKEFYALPVIYNAAYSYEFKKPAPANGFIKTKPKAKNAFKFPYSSNQSIGNVSLLMGDGRKIQTPEPMNFTSSGGFISFNYSFKTEDSFPVKIVVDGKTVLEYMVEVSE